MPQKYIKRLFDDILEFSLKSKGAVVVEGPKWCGKSTTCKRFAKETIDLMPIKTRDEYILEAKISPDHFLKSRGKDDIELAANKLKDIASDIDVNRTRNCSFLMVVTKDSLAYQREDGVYVVPLGCLKN